AEIRLDQVLNPLTFRIVGGWQRVQCVAHKLQYAGLAGAPRPDQAVQSVGKVEDGPIKKAASDVNRAKSLRTERCWGGLASRAPRCRCQTRHANLLPRKPFTPPERPNHPAVPQPQYPWPAAEYVQYQC